MLARQAEESLGHVRDCPWNVLWTPTVINYIYIVPASGLPVLSLFFMLQWLSECDVSNESSLKRTSKRFYFEHTFMEWGNKKKRPGFLWLTKLKITLPSTWAMVMKEVEGLSQQMSCWSFAGNQGFSSSFIHCIPHPCIHSTNICLISLLCQ